MWGFEGSLVLDGLDNLQNLGNSEWAQKVPEVGPILPFLSSLASIDFSGNLPTDYISPTHWDLVFRFKTGMEYALRVEVDPGKTPWNLKLDFSPLDFDLSWLVPFIPDKLGISGLKGTSRIESATLSGPMGDWDKWEAKIRASAEVSNADMNLIDRTLTGVKMDLDLLGTKRVWKGTSSIEVATVNTDVVEGGLRGFRSQDLQFSYSPIESQGDLSGTWTAQDIFGSAYTGTVALSSREGYKVDAVTTNLNWAELPYELGGSWKAKIHIEDPSFEVFDPVFRVTLDGSEFQIGGMDLSSRPVSLSFDGRVIREGTHVTFDEVGIGWGDSLALELYQTEWDGRQLHAREASLTGDLLILSELIPGFRIDPRIEQFIHPKDWKIRGGIRIQTTPFLTIDIEEGRIDSGKGINGPIGFSYSQGERKWALQAPTLQLNLAELAREMNLPQIEIKGNMTVQADFAGSIPLSGETSQAWLSRAYFDGTVSNCNGRFNRLRPDGKLDQHLFGWVGAAGQVSLDWNSVTRAIQSTINMEDFVWYSKPGVTDRPFPQTLRSGGGRLNLNIDQKGENEYDVKKLVMAFGKQDPIELGVSGKVNQSGGSWTPNLSLRIQGNNSPETAVFRGVTLKGSGVFLGKIRGNSRGNWILDGKATLDDLSFEHIVAPVILANARGTFEVVGFPLDEYASESRWNARPHRSISEFRGHDIVNEAFTRMGGTPPNLVVSRMTIGTTRFDQVALRVVREGEFLYMNTASGKFSEGGFPVRMTGYFFFHPRHGVAYRVAGYTQRAPLAMAIPLVGNVGLDLQAVEVRFFITQDLYQEEVQTRYINLGIPIFDLKSIPGLGPSLFNWTPDHLQSKEIIVRQVGDGEWTVLNPVTLGDAIEIPEFILRDIPTQSLQKTRDIGADLIDGFGQGVRDIFEGNAN